MVQGPDLLSANFFKTENDLQFRLYLNYFTANTAKDYDGYKTP